MRWEGGWLRGGRGKIKTCREGGGVQWEKGKRNLEGRMASLSIAREAGGGKPRLAKAAL
jgi:hypothetical protein